MTRRINCSDVWVARRVFHLSNRLVLIITMAIKIAVMVYQGAVSFHVVTGLRGNLLFHGSICGCRMLGSGSSEEHVGNWISVHICGLYLERDFRLRWFYWILLFNCFFLLIDWCISLSDLFKWLKITICKNLLPICFYMIYLC